MGTRRAVTRSDGAMPMLSWTVASARATDHGCHVPHRNGGGNITITQCPALEDINALANVHDASWLDVSVTGVRGLPALGARRAHLA
jgi:Rieske Fe-S protein